MLLLSKAQRDQVWETVQKALEHYVQTVADGRVSPVLDPGGIRAELKSLDFSKPMDPVAAVDLVVQNLSTHQTHTPHPGYYGLYNPAPTTMGIAADALVAGFNPQLAAWSHSPWAVEVEQHLIRALGRQFGYDPDETEGTFASGGAEANHTALLTALTARFPDVGGKGVQSLTGQPTLYVSEECHHSFLKATMLSGLGDQAVRKVSVDSNLRMIPDDLEKQIEKDRDQGCLPFLIVGTAGTTSAGAFDPLPELSQISRKTKVWFHVDAAWGGAAALVPEFRPLLEGIDGSDSITFDAHKMLSVPMGAGIFLTRRSGVLEKTFRVGAGYMPREAAGFPVTDPYSTSIQWSRRFTGLKLFLSLLVAGWDGYTQAIRHQATMSKALSNLLTESDWDVVHRSPMPVLCFVDASTSRGRSQEYLADILDRVLETGETWISIVDLSGQGPALRASVTNYRTGPMDLEHLVELLNQARRDLAQS